MQVIIFAFGDLVPALLKILCMYTFHLRYTELNTYTELREKSQIGNLMLILCLECQKAAAGELHKFGPWHRKKE